MVDAVPPRPRPAFVPTLTEVVRPGNEGVATPGATPPASSAVPGAADLSRGVQTGGDPEVQRLAQRVEQLLERRLRLTLQSALDAQARELAAELGAQLLPLVRQCVADMLLEEARRSGGPR